MFNLGKSITEWRQQMVAGGIKSAEVLDELDGHLREDVERRIRSGSSEQQSFDMAVQQIGKADTLKAEFRKVQVTTERKQMKRNLTILVALFGTVIGGSMVMPALGQWHRTGTLHLWPLLAGVTVALLAGWVAFLGVRRQREGRGRKLISAGIIAAGSFYVAPLIVAFFVQETDLMGWMFCAFLAVASVLFFGTCFRFNRHLSPAPARAN